MNKVSTYIFVHDQNLILSSDHDGKFMDLPNVQYVFLGNKEVDKIINRKDVIIARNLKYNIEQHPKFCSFTGWYALWKNNLIESEYVHLFEYDITINKGFDEQIQQFINQEYQFIGYVPLPISHAFINHPEYTAILISSIKKHYDISINKVVHSIKKINRRVRWSSTSNSTFSVTTFNEYMNWFDKIVNDLKYDKLSGHAHERSITMFYLLFNKRMIFIEGMLRHHMLNSHSKL